MNFYVDLDGTILDNREKYWAAYQTVCEAREMELLPKETILSGTHWGESVPRDFLEDWINELEEPEFAELDVLHEDAKRALDEIRGRVHWLVLVTLRKRRDTLEATLERLGLTGYFDEILNAWGLPRYLIKRELIVNSETFRRNFDTKNSVVIGDQPSDIFAARSIGMKAGAVASGLYTLEELRKHNPQWLAGDLWGLTRMIFRLSHTKRRRR